MRLEPKIAGIEKPLEANVSKGFAVPPVGFEPTTHDLIRRPLDPESEGRQKPTAYERHSYSSCGCGDEVEKTRERPRVAADRTNCIVSFLVPRYLMLMVVGAAARKR